MRLFTKYPSNYIGAASETSGAAMRKKKRAGKEASKLLATDGDWELWTPTTWESSVYLASLGGEKAKWSTAASSSNGNVWFDHVTKRGPLYIFINKSNPAEKYQYQKETNSFYDIDDRRADFDKFICEHPAFADYFDVECDEDIEGCGDINASTYIGAAYDSVGAEDAELVIDTPEWEVWHPLTWQGSCELQKVGDRDKARWCTGYEGNAYYWDAYTKNGPLYIFINKITGEKYQLHIETNSFYDEMDRSLGMQAFVDLCAEVPEIAEYFGDYLGAECPECEDINASTDITAKIKTNFDAIRSALGEDEWYYVEGYILDPDTEYSLEEILFDDKGWEDYCQWKMDKFGKKPNISASTRIRARRYLR